MIYGLICNNITKTPHRGSPQFFDKRFLEFTFDSIMDTHIF